MAQQGQQHQHHPQPSNLFAAGTFSSNDSPGPGWTSATPTGMSYGQPRQQQGPGGGQVPRGMFHPNRGGGGGAPQPALAGRPEYYEAAAYGQGPPPLDYAAAARMGTEGAPPQYHHMGAPSSASSSSSSSLRGGPIKGPGPPGMPMASGSRIVNPGMGMDIDGGGGGGYGSEAPRGLVGPAPGARGPQGGMSYGGMGFGQDPYASGVVDGAREAMGDGAGGQAGGPSSAAATAAAAAAAAARKQNSACDACRSRKVRCNKVPGEAKCVHCQAKGIECTTIYVQLATSSVKRPTKRPRGSAEGDHMSADEASSGNTLVKYLLLRDTEYSNNVSGLSYEREDSSSPPPGRKSQPSNAAESRLNVAAARHEFVSDLIETYFAIVHSRYPIFDAQIFRRRFYDRPPELGGAPPDALTAVILAWGAKFSENPIIVADRRKAAHELTPRQKRKRNAVAPSQGTTGVATALAVTMTTPASTSVDWLQAPTDVVSASSVREASRVIGRSRIAEDLIVKAQEVLDRNKVHRVATLDNVKAALIAQALFWQKNDEEWSSDGDRIRNAGRAYPCNGAWFVCALSHLIELKIHLQSTIDRIQDPRLQGETAMCWFLAVQYDAHQAAFFRRKPRLDTGDYTTQPPMPPMEAPQSGPHPMASKNAYQCWLEAAEDQVVLMRHCFYTLWSPHALTKGVPARRLEELVAMAYRWRDQHLAHVGAPSPSWPSQWNFNDAIVACSSDMNYHIAWVMMWDAIDLFDIEELRSEEAAEAYTRAKRPGSSGAGNSFTSQLNREADVAELRALKARIYDEALNAALRSASLTQVLTNNGYLRLEAGIMRFSMAESGYCLLRFGRPEVASIIDGLRQYGQAFEECYDAANVLEEQFQSRVVISNGDGAGAPPGSSGSNGNVNAKGGFVNPTGMLRQAEQQRKGGGGGEIPTAGYASLGSAR